MSSPVVAAPRVVVVGDIVTDILAVHRGCIAIGSDTPARISIRGGGSAANTAAWLAVAGARADLAAVVGLDGAGTDRLGELAAAGVGLAAVRRCAGAPTGSVLVLTSTTDRSMLTDRGANLRLTPSDVDRALDAAEGVSHLHLSGYPMLDAPTAAAGRYALARAAERGLSTSVDAASAAPLRRLGGPRFLDWVRGCDILLANLDEARVLLGEPDGEAWPLARGLAARVSRAVVKLGRDGAIWAGPRGELVEVAAQPTDVVDPTGAGDAFAAGLLVGWLTGADARACLLAGAALGARAVGVVGGRPPP